MIIKISWKFKLLIIILFQFIQFNNCFSLAPYSKDGYIVYYGTSYRFDNTYRHLISFERFNKSGDCETAIFLPRDDVSLEFTNFTNLNLGYKYFVPLIYDKDINDYVIYLATEINTFYINRNLGLKTSPELGVVFHIGDFCFNMFYAYDIPFINTKSFNMNSNRIVLKFGFIF